jgi:hypothetical protein
VAAVWAQVKRVVVTRMVHVVQVMHIAHIVQVAHTAHVANKRSACTGSIGRAERGMA